MEGKLCRGSGVRNSLLCALAALLGFAASLRADTATVDGAQTFQTIVGIGANINFQTWTNADLEPVLDALIDQAGMTVFRVNMRNSNWEATNDNSNPDVMNWSYYDQVYSSSNFARLWGLAAYLNQKGISNGLMFSFHGYGPPWMLETNGTTLAPGMEDEWAEMIASVLIYARTNRQLQFTLVGPDNEEEFIYSVEGIIVNSSAQYVTALHDLAEKLDTNGLGDIRFVVPDMAYTATSWWTNIMGDPVVMAKVAHFGLHTYVPDGDDYNDGGESNGIAAFLQQSAYPNSDFWVTEYNVGCGTCEGGGGNFEGWEYFLGSAQYLLAQLANGATSATIFEGYDSYRLSSQDPNSYFLSSWGLFALDYSGTFPPPSPVSYTARPNFYTVAQISKFVRPGATRIGVSSSFAPLQAFCQTNLLQLAIVGVNTSSGPNSVTVTLTNLPSVASLELFYTDSTTNLCDAGPVAVVNNAFQLTAPADAIFTVVNTNVLVPPAAPVLSITSIGKTLVLTWPHSLSNYVLESTTSLTPPIVWSPMTNVSSTNGVPLSVLIRPAARQQYFRLKQ
jgi:O-glycosyl hydrolase